MKKFIMLIVVSFVLSIFASAHAGWMRGTYVMKSVRLLSNGQVCIYYRRSTDDASVELSKLTDESLPTEKVNQIMASAYTILSSGVLCNLELDDNRRIVGIWAIKEE